MVEAIASFTRRRLPLSLALLKELVDIPTGVGRADGFARCGDVLAREWSSLDFSVRRSNTVDAPVLIAERAAATPECPVILMLCHLDTVFQSDEARYQRLDDRAFGPGVADMKGGIVVCLDVVRALDELGVGDRFEFLLLVNSDEESSSTHSRALIEQVARRAHLVLVFEPARPSGDIVKARRGLRRYRLSVRGEAAHAGVEPEKGASAIEALARKVVSLQELNRARPDLNVNVGTIKGGSNPNVVPDSAVAEIDVRMSAPETAEWVHGRILSIAQRLDVPRTSATAELYAERPPMVEPRGLPELLSVYCRVGAELGISVSAVDTGGGSDGNFTAALGKLTLDGLGPVGGGYHSEREFVVVESFAERAALTAGVLADLATADDGWSKLLGNEWLVDG